MKKSFLLVATLLWAACGPNLPDFQRILEIEDSRDQCRLLADYLQHPEPRIRARAVQAIGKTQDARCYQALVDALADLNHNVRREAVFALGQLGDPRAERPLIDHLHTKEVEEVKVRILEALGKIGSRKSIPVFMEQFHSSSAALRAEAALSAARLALRKITDSALADSVTTLLRDGHSTVRWKAAYALMQIGRDLPVPELSRVMGDDEVLVRMFAARALGKSNDLSVLQVLAKHLFKDSDWRVRVEAAKALGQFPLSKVANYLTLLNQSGHVRTAIIQAIGASAQREGTPFRKNSREHNLAKLQLDGILFAKDTTPPDYETGFALIAYARLLKELAAPVITEFLTSKHDNIRARAVTALAETGAASVSGLLHALYAKEKPVVKIAILTALEKLGSSDTPVYLQALQEKDQVLVALAAEGLSQDSVKNRIHAPQIVEAYMSLPEPVDPETELMIIHALSRLGGEAAVPALEHALHKPDKVISTAAAAALQKLTGEDLHAQVSRKTTTRPFDYRDIVALQDKQAVITTKHGDIRIRLFAEDAPLTVLNFARLARKGFYDGLTFHRVVPNFVIQGGDPRGDSWGSPGYAIRSEFNSRPYLCGTVGMASAGKDTEGCQFFITHSPQPHLDGRYTVFGQVTSGMDAVNAIVEGDTMQTVVIK